MCLQIEAYECKECQFQHSDLEDFLEHVRVHAFAKEIAQILEDLGPLSVIDDGEIGEDVLEDLMASLPQDMDLVIFTVLGFRLKLDRQIKLQNF